MTVKIRRGLGESVRHVSKTITFTGGAGAGAVGTVTVFTATGSMIIEELTIRCTSDLTEAAPTATVALGVQFSTTRYIAATNATAIDTGEYWHGTTPSAQGAVLIGPGAPEAFGSASGTDGLLIITVGAQNVNGGVLVFDAWYRPITSDALLA